MAFKTSQELMHDANRLETRIMALVNQIDAAYKLVYGGFDNDTVIVNLQKITAYELTVARLERDLAKVDDRLANGA
ncbi:hypothetical protein EOL96_02380 [Candidatus Saccharibacteria bacterium]|nr:hypothetical protein [Candidatus Saccharibacteria bacterium]